METTTTEIAPGIHRLSTYIAEVAPPAGFTFNQILIDGDEPFLFHTGMRGLFPLVSAAVDRVVGLERLRWISFAHVEADECGAMNRFLEASPDAQVIHGDLACSISLDDLCDRPPVRIGEDPLDIGGHRLRFLPTPHVPHNWESGLWFDETTRTLLAGDLFTSLGDGPAIVETSLVEAALIAEDVFHHSSISPTIPATLRTLAELEPTTIACMHGSSFRGDGGAELRALADAYDAVLHGVAA
jgi:flavorubredoxin